MGILISGPVLSVVLLVGSVGRYEGTGPLNEKEEFNIKTEMNASATRETDMLSKLEEIERKLEVLERLCSCLEVEEWEQA